MFAFLAEIQQASRVLFGATMARSSDKELVEIVESLQSRRQSFSHSQLERAAVVLTVSI